MSFDLKKGLFVLGDVLYDHRSEILTGLGIGGFFGTVVMAVKATPTAIEMVNEREVRERVEKLSKKEVVKTVWKLYLPPLLLGMASAGCIIYAQVDCHRQTTALATAYSLAEKSLEEYKQAVSEVVPEKKQQEIRENIASKHIVAAQPMMSRIIDTGHGTQLMIDPMTNQPYYSSINYLDAVVNELNDRMRDEGFISMDDYCDAIGLPHMGEGVGGRIGWHIDTGKIKHEYTSHIREDNTVVVDIGFQTPPTYPRYGSYC